MHEPTAGHPPIHAPLHDVETDRLLLRRFLATDLNALATIFSKPEVWQFPYGRGFTRDETDHFLETQIAEWQTCRFGCWLAVEKLRQRVIGYIGVSVPRFLPEILPAVEVGWRLDPDVWGQGYATEGARAALDQSFTTLGLTEVCSLPQVDNPRSGKVCQRLGMRWQRDVLIPANARRGEVRAQFYNITCDAWRLSTSCAGP